MGYNVCMQQYFIDEELDVGKRYTLDKEMYHHLKHVLRKDDGTNFRIVDTKNEIFLAELSSNEAIILDRIIEDRELDINITVIMSLIKNDKFDFCLQKLTELGVKRIIPYSANRSIIKIKDKDSKIQRYRKIVQEASEQSLRSMVPLIDDIIDFNDLSKYKSKYNYVAYEKNNCIYIPYQEIDDSITIIIGPEGGFEESEIKKFESEGFKPISLGKRILRAETAALYVVSNIVGANER